MTEQLPTIFNYSSTNEYLPIDKQEDLYNFIQQLYDF